MGTNSSKVKSPRAMPPNSPRETPAHVAGEKILEEENFSSLRTEFLKDDVLAALEAYLKEKKISEIVLQRLGMVEVPEHGILLKPLRMETMTTLALDYNQLQQVPDCLALQPIITKVTLSHNRFKHTPSLGNTVTWLDLSWNRITVVDENVSQLVLLRHLDLRHNQLGNRSLPDLSDLNFLEYLDLSENQLTAWPRISANSTLKWLNMAYNVDLGDPQDSFGPYPNLTYLNFTYTKVRVFPKFVMSAADSLVTLDMSNTLISRLPQNFKFVALKNLSIGATKMVPSSESSAEVHDPNWTPPAAISDEVQASMRGLSMLESLETLNLSGIGLLHLPDSVLVASQHANLKCLEVRWNNLYEVPEALMELQSLTSLDLMGNKLSSIPASIAKLTNLEHLSLGHNRLKKLPVEITTLQKLKTLVLEHNLWEDGLFESLYWLNDGVAPIFARILNQEVPGAPTTLPELEGSEEAQLKDRIFGLIFGKALGDAVGLCSEFLMHTQATYTCPTHNLDPKKMHRDRHRVRWVQGDWTDDTDQAILLLETLLFWSEENGGKFNTKIFARNLLQWAEHGFPELGDDGGMGIGQTVARVLRHPLFTTDPHAASSIIWKESGCTIAANGAVMRCAPVSIFGFWEDEKQSEDDVVVQDEKSIAKIPKIGDAVSKLGKNAQLVRLNTLDSCKVTHTDPRCIASCLALNMAIVAILRGEREVAAILDIAFEEGVQAFKVPPEEDVKNTELYDEWSKELKSIIQEQSLDQMDLSETSKIGYTFKCLGAAFACFRSSNDFEQAITKITLSGGDADTNGAAAGALLGAKVGYRALPSKWLECLPHREWLEERAEKAWAHVKSQKYPSKKEKDEDIERT